MAFSREGTRALLGTPDGTVRLWEIATGKELRCFTGHSGDISAVAFSPDGKSALSGGGDMTVRLRQLPAEAGSPPKPESGPSGAKQD